MLAAKKALGIEPPEHKIGVGHGRPPRRRGRSRPDPGSAPALIGPHMQAAASSHQASEPPPAPTSTMSTTGSCIGWPVKASPIT